MKKWVKIILCVLLALLLLALPLLLTIQKLAELLA